MGIIFAASPAWPLRSGPDCRANAASSAVPSPTGWPGPDCSYEPGAVNDLVLLFVVLLTLALAASLVAVIRPPVPTLNQAAQEKLKDLKESFKCELREGAGGRAAARGRKKVKRKDIRAEYRERRVKPPPALQQVTPYGGFTVSVVGVGIAVWSLPRFSRPSPGVSVVSVLVAAIAMVFASPDVFRSIVERLRMPKIHTAPVAAPPDLPVSKRAGKELRRCCERLAKEVEKEARRWVGKREITPEDIERAWQKLIKPRAVAAPAVSTARPLKALILPGLAKLAELIAVAGILYAVFLLAKAKLSVDHHWPTVVVIAAVVIAALFILYLALLDLPRIVDVIWKGLRAIFGTLAVGLVGSLVWLGEKGRGSAARLRRVFGRRSDGMASAQSSAGEEGPATAQSSPDNTAGTDSVNQGSELPARSADRAVAKSSSEPGPSPEALADLAAQLTPANALARTDTITARATIAIIAIGLLLVGLGIFDAGQLTHDRTTRALAVATVFTATLAVACALIAQALAISRQPNPADLDDVRAWFRRQISIRSYATQVATILLISAILLVGAAAVATIMVR
jgi:histone H3/H4